MILLFDLDQTLIDSEVAEPYRSSGSWNRVYRMIDQGDIIEYEGVSELLSFLNRKRYKTGLITSSPSQYVERIIQNFNWHFNTKVCFHDTIFNKPNPDPIFKALSNLNLTIRNDKIFLFGDQDIDVIASKKAGIKSVACLWGAKNKKKLESSIPDIIIKNINQVYDLVSITSTYPEQY